MNHQQEKAQYESVNWVNPVNSVRQFSFSWGTSKPRMGINTYIKNAALSEISYVRFNI